MADENVLEEFLINVLYNVDERKRKDFNEGLTESFTKAKLLGDALEAMAARGVAAIERYVTGMERLHYVSRNTGASVQNLQAMGFAAAQLGGHAEDAVDAVQSLIQKFKESPGNAQFVENVLGVRVGGRDPTAIILDIVKRLEKMPAYLRLSYEKMVGLTEQQFLVLSNPEVEKQMERFIARQKQMGLDPQKTAADSAEFMRAWRELGDVISNVGSLIMSKIVGGAAPALTHFTDYLAEHGSEIADVIVKILNAIADLITKFLEFLPHLDKMVEEFGGWDKVLHHVGAALLAILAALGLLAAMALPEWLLVMLGVGGAAALYDGLNKTHVGPMGNDEIAKRREGNDVTDASNWNPRNWLPSWAGGHKHGGVVGGGDDESPVNVPPAPVTNERLAASRKQYMDELKNNPQLRRDVIKTASLENNGSPEKMQTVLESMFNRAQMYGYHSLHSAIHSGFYGPVNRGGLSGGLSARDRRDGEIALAAVAAGGNLIQYRTDQGMLTDPGARRYMQMPDHSGHARIRGENFFFMGDRGKAWARREVAADKAYAESHKAPPISGPAGASKVTPHEVEGVFKIEDGDMPPPPSSTPRIPTRGVVGMRAAAGRSAAGALGVRPSSIPTISNTTNAPSVSNHFNIEGAVSPAETARKVHDKISDVHSDLARNMRNGVG